MGERRYIDLRVIIGALAIAGLPAYLLIDLAAAWWQGWWTTNSTYLAVIVICGLLVSATVLALSVLRGRDLLRRKWGRFLSCTVALLFSVMITEVTLQLTLGHTLLFHRHIPNVRRRFAPNPDVIAGITGESFHTANSLGIRGSEFPSRNDAYRILCVGGSTTACTYLDGTETWPRLVMDKLNRRQPERRVWVGDVGRSGYGSWHHVRFLESERLLRQVDCLLILLGINDLGRACQGRRILSPLGVKPLWERSNIYAVAHNIYQRHKHRRKHLRHLEETADGATYVMRRQLRKRGGERRELPDIQQGLAEYRTNLRSIISRCRSLGVRVVFMTQPVIWRADLPAEARDLLWLGVMPDGSSLSVSALAEGMRVFNDALKEVCRAENVECIDLSSMNGTIAFYYDDAHFTEAGAEHLASRVAAWFLDHPW